MIIRILSSVARLPIDHDTSSARSKQMPGARPPTAHQSFRTGLASPMWRARGGCAVLVEAGRWRQGGMVPLSRPEAAAAAAARLASCADSRLVGGRRPPGSTLTHHHHRLLLSYPAPPSSWTPFSTKPDAERPEAAAEPEAASSEGPATDHEAEERVPLFMSPAPVRLAWGLKEQADLLRVRPHPPNRPGVVWGPRFPGLSIILHPFHDTTLHYITPAALLPTAGGRIPDPDRLLDVLLVATARGGRPSWVRRRPCGWPRAKGLSMAPRCLLQASAPCNPPAPQRPQPTLIKPKLNRIQPVAQLLGHRGQRRLLLHRPPLRHALRLERGRRQPRGLQVLGPHLLGAWEGDERAAQAGVGFIRCGPGY